MKNLTEQVLVEAVKRGLEHSVTNLDAATREKLYRVRLQALERVDRPSGFSFFSSPFPSFAMVAVFTLGVALWVLPNAPGPLISELPMASVPEVFSPDVAEAAMSGASTMEVLMSNEEMDFLEDLEMYEWLEAEYG